MTVEDLMVAVVVLTSQYMIDITVFDDEKQFVVVTNAYSSDCHFRRSAFGDDPYYRRCICSVDGSEHTI